MVVDKRWWLGLVGDQVLIEVCVTLCGRGCTLGESIILVGESVHFLCELVNTSVLRLFVRIC